MVFGYGSTMKFSLASSLVFCSLGSPGLGRQAQAAQPANDFPFLITCEYNGATQFFYLSRIDAAGLATYVSPNSRAGTISVDGKAKAIGEPTGGSCLDKTLDELQSAGQTRSVPN